jgi:hypothetical protein
VTCPRMKHPLRVIWRCSGKEVGFIDLDAVIILHGISLSWSPFHCLLVPATSTAPLAEGHADQMEPQADGELRADR